MAGRPQGSEPRDQLIQIRVTKTERKVLDQKRGAQKISDYVRRLIFGEAS